MILGDVEADAAFKASAPGSKQLGHCQMAIARLMPFFYRRHAHLLAAAAQAMGRTYASLKPCFLSSSCRKRRQFPGHWQDLETEYAGGFVQPLGMLGKLEDLAAIGALTLEHGAGIVQPVQSARESWRRPI